MSTPLVGKRRSKPISYNYFILGACPGRHGEPLVNRRQNH